MSGQYKNASFLKPREKIRLRGAEALSDRELLQLIIGSGTAKIGAAKLAKHVLRLIKDSEEVSFQDLLTLPGLGVAQASRLAAVYELNRRTSRAGQEATFRDDNDFLHLIPPDSRDLWLVTLNGSRRLIERRILDQPLGTALIRVICTYMIKDSAARLIVLKRVDTLTPTLADLSLGRNLKLAVRPFEIKVNMLLIHGENCRSIITEPRHAR